MLDLEENYLTSRLVYQIEWQNCQVDHRKPHQYMGPQVKFFTRGHWSMLLPSGEVRDQMLLQSISSWSTKARSPGLWPSPSGGI